MKVVVGNLNQVFMPGEQISQELQLSESILSADIFLNKIHPEGCLCAFLDGPSFYPTANL